MIGKLIPWLRADETATDGRGWSVNLDIFRLIFLAFAVLPWAIRNLAWINSIMPGIPREAWAPVSFYRFLPLSLLNDAAFVRTLAIANLLCIALAFIGLRTRLSLAGATVLSLYLFGLTQNQGKIDHMHHLIWFLALLAAGPSGRFLSIDSLLRAKRNGEAGLIDPPKPPFDALWTLRYVWLMMGLLYLIPGLAKLQKAMAAGWASPTNLRYTLWRKWFELALFDPSATWHLRVDQLPAGLLELTGVGAIAFEAGFLFFVLFRRFRIFTAIAGLMFHIGNGLVLQIWFTTLFAPYVSLIDWCALGRKLSRAKRAPAVVLYDRDCRFCRSVIAMLKSIDLFDVLKPAPIQTAMSGDEQQSAPAGCAGRAEDLCLVDGDRTLVGYDAYIGIARRLLLLWPAVPIMEFGPVATAGRRVYRRVADSRHCAIAAQERAPLVQSPTSRSLRIVGPGLVALQFSLSFMMFAYAEFPRLVSRMPRPVEKLISAVGRANPAWPFAYYPTFSAVSSETADIWEARWVTGEQEQRVSPQAYYKAFRSSGMLWNLVSEDHDADEAWSLALVKTLWNAEPAETRKSIVGARVYRAWYRLPPPEKAPGTPVRASLLCSFPAATISR